MFDFEPEPVVVTPEECRASKADPSVTYKSVAAGGGVYTLDEYRAAMSADGCEV